MITVMARLKIKPGKEEAAFEAAKRMVSKVEAEEPGALAYVCHRLQQNSSDAEMVFYEVYADGDALGAHGKTDHMSVFRGEVAELFDVSQIKIDRLERVAGFVRADAT